MLIGSIDSGKTTTAKYLLTKLSAQPQLKIGFIDADIGQSTLGPPGTIGAAVFDNFIPDHDWEAQANDLQLRFIGAFSPVGHTLEILLAIKKLIDYLNRLQCNIILLDTTGLVFGKSGFYLKKSKIELLQPSHLIVFQSHNEFYTLLTGNFWRQKTTVSPLPVSENVQKRSLAQRQFYRERKLADYFQNSELLELPFPEYIQWRKDLVTTTYLPPQQLKKLSSLFDREIYCASITQRMLFIVSDHWFYQTIPLSIKQEFFIDSIYTTSKHQFINRYISLEDSLGTVVGLGIVKDINFKHQTITIKTTCRDSNKIYSITIGTSKLTAI